MSEPPGDDIVHYDVDRAIATITLDSPANRNALSARLIGQLTSHLGTAAADPSVRAVVLTHTGRTFCAGADLAEGAADGGPAKGTARMVALLRAIVELPRPVVAKIDGHVRAGGLGIVAACDLAVAGPGSTFAFTEVRLGLAPAVISLTTVARMSPRALSRYYLTGETFLPDAAAASGLVTAAAEDTAVEIGTISETLRTCSPQGLAETKRLITAPLITEFDEHADQLQALSTRLFQSEDAREGISAFLERRAPSWAPGPA